MSKKMLIVFYSWSNGNTERIAKMLQETTGADMVQISAARTRQAGRYHLMDGQNPVWIFSGEGRR